MEERTNPIGRLFARFLGRAKRRRGVARFKRPAEEVLAEGISRFSLVPLGCWSYASDGGEIIFRDFILKFGPDGKGTAEYWTIDNGRRPDIDFLNNRSDEFEYRSAGPLRLEVRIIAPESERTVWERIAYRLSTRQSVYGEAILTITFDAKAPPSPKLEEDKFWAFRDELDRRCD
jgi:hypothetical protein